MTFVLGGLPAQWELFAKKRTYTERKRSRPSGSVPPVLEASSRARASSEITQARGFLLFFFPPFRRAG